MGVSVILLGRAYSLSKGVCRENSIVSRRLALSRLSSFIQFFYFFLLKHYRFCVVCVWVAEIEEYVKRRKELTEFYGCVC